MDEKSFTRGHRYFTLFNDLERGRVLFVAENRTTESGDEFWSSLSAEPIDAVEDIDMYMWDPYVSSTLNHLPEARRKIVFDKFHKPNISLKLLIWFAGRKNRQLRAGGDDRLTGGRHDWLRHPAKMEPEDRKAFTYLRNSNLKTARAWAPKEAMMAFFEYFCERPPSETLSLVAQPGPSQPPQTNGRKGPDD